MYVCKIKQKKETEQYFNDVLVLEFESVVNIGIFLDSIVERYPSGYEFSAEIETKKEDK